MDTNKKLSGTGRRLRSGKNYQNCDEPETNCDSKCYDGKGAKTKCIYRDSNEFRQPKTLRGEKFPLDKRRTPLQQITSDLHKMEKKMNSIDFSFLEVEKLSTQLENESLALQLKFLQGE